VGDRSFDAGSLELMVKKLDEGSHQADGVKEDSMQGKKHDGTGESLQSPGVKVQGER